MHKLFAALRDLNPGYEVADIRFLVDVAVENNQSLSEIDDQFSAAVRDAKDFEWATLKSA
ncbi:hypothetical protein [Acetobacter malorum]|nr:hypothetical protein [Acetobacter malorum]